MIWYGVLEKGKVRFGNIDEIGSKDWNIGKGRGVSVVLILAFKLQVFDAYALVLLIFFRYNDNSISHVALLLSDRKS